MVVVHPASSLYYSFAAACTLVFFRARAFERHNNPHPANCRLFCARRSRGLEPNSLLGSSKSVLRLGRAFHVVHETHARAHCKEPECWCQAQVKQEISKPFHFFYTTVGSETDCESCNIPGNTLITGVIGRTNKWNKQKKNEFPNTAPQSSQKHPRISLQDPPTETASPICSVGAPNS